ncbi:MAG: hypothetical protein ACR2FS_03105 [Phormidesmis sp.]
MQDSLEAPATSPATPQQQREYARARKARKQARRESAKVKRDLPLPAIPKEIWDFMVALAGEKQARKSARFVAKRREDFLDTSPAIRAATVLKDGLMIVETALLSDSEKAALAEFAGRVCK